MSKRAIFPGSFDPFTLGHEDILLRAAELFDEIIVAIGVNSQKKYLLPLDVRLELAAKVFEGNPKISVESYHGLTVNFCQEKGIDYIIRGIRSASDFDYEKTIAHLNSAMVPGLETILILARPELSSVSSTIVREIVGGGGDVSKFVPPIVAEALKR